LKLRICNQGTTIVEGARQITISMEF